MPNTTQINRYIVNHGVKDQLLAMFDQTLRSNQFDKADPWYVKSLFDLTYLIRDIVSGAVKEHMTLLSPLEIKKVVDQEIVKLYWHFFSAQKGNYDQLNLRYKGIERLKTLSYVINKANFCIKNPNNINANLKLAGFEEWGESFLNFNSNVASLASLQEQLDHLLTFKALLNDAIKDTKAFRAQNKSSDENNVQVNTFANKLSKGLKVKRLLDELDNKLDALEQAIKEESAVKSNQSEHIKHAFVEISEDVDYTYDSDGDISYDEKNAYTVDIDVSTINPKLRNLLNLSLNNYEGDGTEFERKLLSLLETSFGFRLIDLHASNFNELEPLLLETLETSDLAKVEMFLASVYPKRLPSVEYLNLHPELARTVFWPSPIEKKDTHVEIFDDVMSAFNTGIKFKRSKEVSDFNLSNLLNRKEMSHFYQFYAQKMCSFTPELSGFPEQRYKSIKLERVDQRFKACTADLVFKFASLAKVLKCNELSKEEIEDLGVQIEKTVIFLNRVGKVNPYDFIAKWSLKRYCKLNNRTIDFVKDKKHLDMFSAFYSSDFESEDNQLMSFFSTDELSDKTHAETKHKFELIGGFDGLDNKDHMMEVVNLFGNHNKQVSYSKLNKFLDEIYIEKTAEAIRASFNIRNVKSDMGQTYHSAQRLCEGSKKLLMRYALLRHKITNNAAHISSKDLALIDYIKLNEKIFDKSIYQFSDRFLSTLGSFIESKGVNYEGWQSWLKENKVFHLNHRDVDVFVLYEMQANKADALDVAVKDTLTLLDSSHTYRSGAAQLTYIEKNIKNHSESYGALVDEAKQITQSNYTSPKKARLLPLSRAQAIESDKPDFKLSNEIGRDIIALFEKLCKETQLSLSLNLVGLLKSEAYDTILDQELLSSVKKMFHEHTKSSVSDAVITLLESERLLKDAGYTSDFSDEAIEDLPSYHVFFSHLPQLKQKQFLDLLSSEEQKSFSPKALRDALILKEKVLLKSIEDQQKIVDAAKLKNNIASDFANELRLIFLAFNAVNKEAPVESINLGEAVSISGVTPDVDRPMMIRLMSTMKKVDLIDESNLKSIISLLKLVEKVKSVGLSEKDAILSQLDKEDSKWMPGLKQRLLFDFSQLKKGYKGGYKFQDSGDETALQEEFFVFVDAIKTLRGNQIEDQETFISTARNAMLKVPVTDLLNEMDAEAIVGLVRSLGQNSLESNEIRSNLDKEKLAYVTDTLYSNTSGFIDVDLNGEDDLAISEKTLFFLNQHCPDIYDKFAKKHLYNNVYHLTRPLEKAYLDYLLEEADVAYEKAKEAYDPSKLNTVKALADTKQANVMLGSVKSFCINGHSEMFFMNLMFLLPGNNRKLLDQLVSQFSPTWAHELSINRNKEIADMSLSTQLLAHHGAAKLFNNNLNYHMPKEVADISMLISLTMFIVSILLSWGSIAIGVMAATFAASVFMKVCVMHNRAMALKPYSIYDRLGLMESLEQVKSIWVKYDNPESTIMVKMLEYFEILNDAESLHNYDRQFPKRINYINLVKLSEFEKECNVEFNSQASIADRVVNVFLKQPSFLAKKLFLKQIDMRSNIALSDGQLESAKNLSEHAMNLGCSEIKSSEETKNILVSYLQKEYPDFSQERLVALYNFIFDSNSVKHPLKTKDPLEAFADNDIAKFLSNMYAIKKVKAQLEDFSKQDECFPTFHALSRIPDMKVEDVKLMEDRGVKSFSDLENLIDSTDFSGTSLKSCEYNHSVKNIIVDYMRSSGDNIRMAAKIKPMSMFGCIKIDEKDGDEDLLQSSFSLEATGTPLSA